MGERLLCMAGGARPGVVLGGELAGDGVLLVNVEDVDEEADVLVDVPRDEQHEVS